MNSLERLKTTLAHRQPDRVCVDFGSTLVTGMSVIAVTKLRKALLGDEGHKVKVVDPYQMLGEIDPALREALCSDVLPVTGSKTLFGFENEDWKPFTMFDGTEVLVPGNFNVTESERGGWLIYPEGDTSAAPSGWMPRDGFYFDALCRQDPIDEANLNPEDNLAEFGPLSDGSCFISPARPKPPRPRAWAWC